MGKLTRYTQIIFGTGAATDEMLEFGSLFNGTPAYYDGATITPGIVQGLANYVVGWFAAAIGANSPTIQEMNALFFLVTYQLAYLMQAGISEYDSATPYYIGSKVNLNGSIYTSLTNNNVGNALTDATNWQAPEAGPANSILNSAFDYAQRGGSINAAGSVTDFVYGPDRWALFQKVGSGSVVNISQQTGVLPGSFFGLQANVSTAPSSFGTTGVQVVHILSNLDSLPYLGKNACFSVNVKATGNVNSVSAQLFYNTSDSGVAAGMVLIGSPVPAIVSTSGFVQVSIVNQAITSAMTRFGVVGVLITATGASTGHVTDISNGFVLEQAMLHVGGVLAPYKRAHASTASEYLSLQAFYEKSYDPAINPGTATPFGAAQFGAITTNYAATNPYYKTVKRTSNPTVTLWDPATGSAGTIRDVTGSHSYTGIANNNSQSAFNASIAAAAGFAAGDVMEVHWTSDSEIY